MELSIEVLQKNKQKFLHPKAPSPLMENV